MVSVDRSCPAKSNLECFSYGRCLEITEFELSALCFPLDSFHIVEDGADYSADHAPLHRLSASFVGHVPLERMSQFGNWKCLEPDSTGASQNSQKNSVTAEDHIFDSRHGRDLERNAGLECSHMAGMNPQSFAGLKIANHEFSRKFEPSGAQSAHLLQQKAVAAENARAQRLLKANADLNLRSGAEEAVAVNHVLVSGRDFNGYDVTWEFGREGELTRDADSPVLSHKNGSPAGNPLEHAEKTSAAAKLGVRHHLD